MRAPRSVLCLFLAFFTALVHAYIPALPTNSTRDAIAAGLNITDVSKLSLRWYSNGSYMEHVSYQLVGNGTTGVSKGALVHFSEDMAAEPPTSTPWIALVSCDRNATNASMVDDIFTLARDRGAVSALLYSLTSAACIINPAYADPSTFDQVFDIFSTPTPSSSLLIEYQFGQLGPPSKSIYNYSAQRLDNARDDILQSLQLGYPVSTGYLLATLQAYNATDPSSDPTNGDNQTARTTGGSNGSSQNTALAMIILYAITGCVSALFCAVVISGAIRAIRHPERYGPRARMGDDGLPPQSRARGLTRAILDTFPIVKFGSLDAANALRDKDPERQHGSPSLEMTPHKRTDTPTTHASELGDNALTASVTGSPSSTNLSSRGIPPSHSRDIHEVSVHDGPSRSANNAAEIHEAGRQGSTSDAEDIPVRVARPADSNRDTRAQDVALSAIGKETCPICIVDFEEGDDIRVLPCEGHHCFHQQCVDPWLLQLSSSCPICRHDFLALENILSGNSDDGHDAEMDYRASMFRASHGGRFSRYLRFARRRQPPHPHRNDQEDPTDPYMAPAPVTSIYPMV